MKAHVFSGLGRLMLGFSFFGATALSHAHTVAVASIGVSLGSSGYCTGWTSGNSPATSYPGSWTMELDNSYGYYIRTRGTYNLTGAGSAGIYPTYTWNLVWTPGYPGDTPTGDVVLDQRYLYDLTSNIGGSTTNTGQMVTWFTDAYDLPNQTATAQGVAPQNSLPCTNGTTWTVGSTIVIHSPTWTAQMNGTYTYAAQLSDSVFANCAGNESSPTIATQQLISNLSYQIQATLVSVDDINFTPFS